MTIEQMIALCYGQYGNRYQVAKSQMLAFLSQVQIAAFDANIPAFLDWDTALAITEGTLGPYAWPSNCRSVLGVTACDDAAIFGNPALLGSVDQDYGIDDDYARSRNTSVSIWTPGRTDPIAKTYYFLYEPSTDETYRWAYYRQPEDLTSTTTDGTTTYDDTQILIPAEWHDRVLIQGCMALCDRSNYGDTRDTPQIVLKTILEPFWNAMRGRTVSSESPTSMGAW